MDFKLFFHYLSYLQYPLMLVALYFVLCPYFNGIDFMIQNPKQIFEYLNNGLFFLGLGTSFSSLQDTTKTQNKLSKNVWENPKKGKIMIILMSLFILIILLFGLIGYLFNTEGILKDLSIGLIVLGLGMFGFLKAAIEMFENHRKDKNPN